MIFELPLVEEKVKRQQVLTLHLVVAFTWIITGIFLGMLHWFVKSVPVDKQIFLHGFTLPFFLGYGVLSLGLLLFAFIILKNKWVTEKVPNRWIRIIEFFLLIFLAVYAALLKIWVPTVIYGVVSLAVLFALYWEGITDNTLYICINERGIKLPVTSRKRFLAWAEVERVLLRFGILTIECCDNRLFQWNISGTDYDKEKLHQFCNTRILESENERSKYAW
ncbi:MAG: hypothetical protein JSS64_05455 [Bacteroidetes bacterium]|nr:hypothetical protein [Bacteroidota bacterium]